MQADETVFRKVLFGKKARTPAFCIEEVAGTRDN